MVAPLILAGALALVPELLKLAPSLVRELVGDDAGDVAERVSTVVQAVTGTTDPAGVAAAVADPVKAGELAVALEKLRVELESERERQATERFRLATTDAAGARAMGGPSERMQLAQIGLGFLTVCLFSGALVMLWIAPVSTGSERLFDVLLGTLGTVMVSTVSFFFGSSAGGAAKTRAIAG